MSSYLALLNREWREWRTVLALVGVLYVIGLIGSAVALRKGTEFLIQGKDDAFWEQEMEELEHLEREGFDFGQEWFDPKDVIAANQSQLVLFGWTHLLRMGLSFINLAILVLALFYLADAVYKERSDGSTLFYKGLPVGDLGILSSKLLVGTVGLLGVSFLLAMGWVVFAQATFPGSAADMLARTGYSPSQVAFGDLVGDWAIFHVLQLAWLSPFAVYFLLVSTVTRSRPVLVGVGVPLIVGLVWRFMAGDNSLLTELTANLKVLGEILVTEWSGREPNSVMPGQGVALFGSFWQYLLSPRSLVSLLAAGGLFGVTFLAYRKNMPVS
ncbi:MAG: hypothetical protein V3U35_05190 [Candidatus Neomarinimicrobiota bacterium]